MKFLAFAASHRPDSLNRKLALCAVDAMRGLGAEVEFVEYSEFDMPLYSAMITDTPPAAHTLATLAKNADGIILSMPEYNWSFPANLKNIIDWLSTISPAPLAGKTILLMSATTGGRGGILGLQQVKTPLEHLEMFIFNRVFPLAYAQNAFSENGELTDETQKTLLSGIIKDYHAFTKKLS